MKRFLALFLAAVMLTGMLFGCAKRDPNDKGATITMYLAADPSNTNLDPAKVLYTAETVKFIGLLFEGITKVDENGQVVKGMAKNWTFDEDTEHGVYKMMIELKYSRWSDGRQVSADDFVYAWKRVLEPEFYSPGSALLYQIKNARAVKEGDMTIDDLGVSAVDMTLLEITFEGDQKPDYDKFLENLASISLVPIREDTITPDPEGWATKTLTLLTNGPFILKTMDYAKQFTFERSIYYFLEGKKNENIFKYVQPFRLDLIYTDNLDKMEQRYASNDKVFYLGSLPEAKFESYKNSADLKDMLSSYIYYFNASVAPFDKPQVRKALSIALDRNEIAKIYGLGVKPATGFVPTGIIDDKINTDFREKGGDLIPAAGNISEAKSLLQQAGVSGSPITLTIRKLDNERKVAEYVASVWKQLGFEVTIKEVTGKAISETLFTHNFEVMGVDFQSVGIDAFSVLAPFSTPFGGTTVTFLNEGESAIAPNLANFKDDSYDAIMEEVMAAIISGDHATKTAKLHEAESKFIELSPAAPLFFHTNINVTKDVTGLEYSKFGYTIFSKAKLKDYLQYTTALPTQAPAE